MHLILRIVPMVYYYASSFVINIENVEHIQIFLCLFQELHGLRDQRS